MGEYRAAIAHGAPIAEVSARAERLQALFRPRRGGAGPAVGDGTTTFLSALTILVREGLEALLIVVAMIGFLRKAERTAMLKYVHIGWVSALVAGFATWWVANHFITISGAGRELTEGFGSLLAAAILLFVGIWMHGKAQAGAWQAYVKAKLDRALGRGFGLVLPVRSGLHRRLSRSVRDDHLLRGDGGRRQWRPARARHRRRAPPLSPWSPGRCCGSA